MSTAEDMSFNEEHALDFEERQLFTHDRRPEWGAGVLVDLNQRHLVFQFQDGVMRRFRREYRHLFSELDAPEALRESMLDRLQEKHAESQAVQRQRQQPLKAPVMSLEEQLRVFRELYPAGFADPAYLKTWRREEGRKLKRHVDPDIARAKKLLRRSALEGLIEDGRFSEVHDRLVTIFRRTALVSPSTDTKPLAALPAAHHEALARGLAAMLHGEERYSDRLRDYILVLDGLKLPISWGMVTAPGALLSPGTKLCPRRSVFRLQARGLKQHAVIRASPTPRSYRNALRIAKRLRSVLADAALEPQDLLDVRNFIWETLRPRGRAVLEALSSRA